MITKELFRAANCQMCGSQRCDGSDEMMDFCGKFINENLQGLCKHCAWRFNCHDARRWLNMIECNQFVDSKEVFKYETTNNCAKRFTNESR